MEVYVGWREEEEDDDDMFFCVYQYIEEEPEGWGVRGPILRVLQGALDSSHSL